MTSSTPFDDYLAGGESSELVGSATLFQEPTWTPASICVTDRRILFVPTDGGFVDVPRGQVLSIRSRPTTRRGNWELGAQATLVAGLALALLAAGALLVGAGSGPIALFALMATTGTLATAGLTARTAGLLDVDWGPLGSDDDQEREDGLLARTRLADRSTDSSTRTAGLGADHVTACVDRIDASLASIDELIADTVIDDALGDADPIGAVDVHRRYERPAAQFVEAWPLVGWLAVSIALIGVGALLALTAWIPLGLTLAVVLGVASAAVGFDHLPRADDRRIHRERSVVLYLHGGRTVRFRIDDDASIDRELSRLTVGQRAFPPTEGPDVADERTADRAVSTER
ncbi:hypothetical protein [Salinarchaeum laminariae]|uniref:hypothetical protein n=1 Tax=Salinarchaeum laminariae TaxID=869888 RepID=UPI0020BEDA1C|nr:hypothetical protein [Salinarchaeum laminariae]